MSDDKRIIEINGVKIEVDLRTAKTIDTFKVGDRVKVLVKGYNDTYSSHFGVIVGFDEFKERPTVVVAYLDVSYSTCEVKFVYLNKDSKDIEIVLAGADDAPFASERAEEMMDRVIVKAEKELAEAHHKKAIFQKWVGKYFSEAAAKGDGDGS